MARTHFTVGDVEALIPALERIFIDVLQLRAALRAIEDKLERAGVKMSREELLESDDGPAEVRRAKALFRGFYEALSDEIERVRALGGEVKDIEHGAGRLPGRRRGEDILLCWRLGEKTIGYWHARRSRVRAAAAPSTTKSRARRNRWTRSGRPCRASRHCEPPSRRCCAASGLDPARDADLRDTPARVARLWQAEFLAGYGMDPGDDPGRSRRGRGRSRCGRRRRP